MAQAHPAAQTVNAIFDDYSDAAEAVNELEAAGFDRDSISLIASSPDDRSTVAGDEDTSATSTGASIGSMVGGGTGLLAGLGMLAIPGLGPVVAAGWVVATLAGAAAGALSGGLIGALVDAGTPEEEANLYAESVRRGSTLISVRAPQSRFAEVRAILDRHSPVDIANRAAAYRESGWQRFDESAEIEKRSRYADKD